MKKRLVVLTLLILIAGFTITAGAATIVAYTFSDGNASTATNAGTLGVLMNGTIVGGSITSSPFSPDNQALLLGGSTGNGISMANGYDFGAAFTVESLVRLDALQGSQNILFDDFGGPGVSLSVNTSTQKLAFSATTADNGSLSLVSPGIFTIGQWHHVAGIYSGSEMLLYLDGMLIASQNATGLVQNHAAVAPNVGVESDDLSLPWLGAIDDFRIHDTALSASSLNGGNSVPGVPAPGAIWLFGSGLLGLFGVARREKS